MLIDAHLFWLDVGVSSGVLCAEGKLAAHVTQKDVLLQNFELASFPFYFPVRSYVYSKSGFVSFAESVASHCGNVTDAMHRTCAEFYARVMKIWDVLKI